MRGGARPPDLRGRQCVERLAAAAEVARRCLRCAGGGRCRRSDAGLRGPEQVRGRAAGRVRHRLRRAVRLGRPQVDYLLCFCLLHARSIVFFFVKLRC